MRLTSLTPKQTVSDQGLRDGHIRRQLDKSITARTGKSHSNRAKIDVSMLIIGITGQSG